jgi:hypothetical protein
LAASNLYGTGIRLYTLGKKFEPIATFKNPKCDNEFPFDPEHLEEIY